MEAFLRAVIHPGSLTFYLPHVKKHQQLLHYGISEEKYYVGAFSWGLSHTNTLTASHWLWMKILFIHLTILHAVNIFSPTYSFIINTVKCLWVSGKTLFKTKELLLLLLLSYMRNILHLHSYILKYCTTCKLHVVLLLFVLYFHMNDVTFS